MLIQKNNDFKTIYETDLAFYEKKGWHKVISLPKSEKVQNKEKIVDDNSEENDTHFSRRRRRFNSEE